MIVEGAGPDAGSRRAQAKSRPAWTLISGLVQPRGCNPAPKKAVQTERHRSTASEGNDENEETSSPETVYLLTSEAI